MEHSGHTSQEAAAHANQDWASTCQVTESCRCSCDLDGTRTALPAKCGLCASRVVTAAGYGDGDSVSPLESLSRAADAISVSTDNPMNMHLSLERTLWDRGQVHQMNGCGCKASSFSSNDSQSAVHLNGVYMTGISAANLGFAGSTTSCVFCASNRGSYTGDSTPAKAAWPLHELDDEDIIDRVTNAFSEWANETRRWIAIMEERLSAGRSATQSAHPFTAANKAKIWKFLVSNVNTFNRQLLAFAQQCPGFEYISPPDKVALVKQAVLAVWLITRAELFIDGETYLLLPDQSVYTRAWMTTFLPEELVESMHRYASCQTAAGLTTRELSLLCAITLVSGRDAELIGRQDVDIVKERLVQALLLEVNRSRVYAAETLASITQLLADLVAISKQQDIIFNKSLEAIP